MSEPDNCPCGSGKDYGDCCGRFIGGRLAPETAEELMRSRYTAYTMGRDGYLRDTWHPTTRRKDLPLKDPVTWLGLDIKHTEAGGADDTRGVVEFVARYKVGGQAHRLHEISRFARREGRWYYLDGEPGPTGT